MESDGIGLHACQIGSPYDMFALGIPPHKEKAATPFELAREPTPMQIIINPTIEDTSVETMVYYEGCLSQKGELVWVERFEKVLVSYFDENGAFHPPQWWGGILSVLFQHEDVGHGEGGLITDQIVDDDEHAWDEAQWEQFKALVNKEEFVKGGLWGDVLWQPEYSKKPLFDAFLRQMEEAERKASHPGTFQGIKSRLSYPGHEGQRVKPGTFLTNLSQKAKVDM